MNQSLCLILILWPWVSAAALIGLFGFGAYEWLKSGQDDDELQTTRPTARQIVDEIAARHAETELEELYRSPISRQCDGALVEINLTALFEEEEGQPCLV